MKKPAKTPDEILKEAKSVKEKETLAPHEQTIRTLREKKYSWREIAEFLRERGIDTDHSKVFRFIQKTGSTKMQSQPYRVPSAEEYIVALKAIKITEIQLKMLRFHYYAPNRTATFTELAESAGNKNYRFANSNYGKLGTALGKQLGMTFTRLYDDDPESQFCSSAIGTAKQYEKSDEWKLIMHHELGKALQELRWFEEPSA